MRRRRPLPQLAHRRSQIDKLVGVRRLLKKLEFLFELPQRLNRSIELEAYSQAAKYFNMTSGIPDFDTAKGWGAALKTDKLRAELTPAPAQELVSAEQMAALQARLEQLHAAQLLSDEEFFALENLCSDFLEVKAATVGPLTQELVYSSSGMCGGCPQKFSITNAIKFLQERT